MHIAEIAPVRLVGSDGRLYIGAVNNLDEGNFWNDLIDDVQIYNQAITP